MNQVTTVLGPNATIQGQNGANLAVLSQETLKILPLHP